MKTSANWRRSLGLGLAVISGLIIYAYGFQVTKISLDETRSERRQASLVRILRALAQPDVIAYDTAETTVEAAVQVPCPAGGFTSIAPAVSGAYLVVSPACAAGGSQVKVEGFNFQPETSGPLNFIPPSGVSLSMGTYQSDAAGHFVVTVKLPQRDSEEPQAIRTVTSRRVGSTPHLSQNGKDTWDKIIETVFLALLATTVGTALSIPISFLAASNIMKPITSPLSSVALSLLALPIGLGLGAAAAMEMSTLSLGLTANAWVGLLGLIVGAGVMVVLMRWALPPEETTRPPLGLRLARLAALLAAALAGILSLFLLASLAMTFGHAIGPRLGALGFLATFIADLGDILGTSLVLISALAGAGVLISVTGRLGEFLTTHLAPALNKGLAVLLTTAAGAVVGSGIASGLNWLYQFHQAGNVLLGFALAGGALGLVLALRLPARAPLPIGSVIYTVTRTILNALRSVEALVMAIVFVVWVGIGPFAGTLALALHTIAALAKLYSEQVESIMAGPLEAVQATGATRLQTIVYAVVPQIIPPYISFTMYRWDINVRMSTIIGFVGGGGIGFLLQQNINLLNYRAASAQMVAIAIVVASMDYLSAKLRERVI
jgi:phosphonate ABC transporter permease subunit PhnE